MRFQDILYIVKHDRQTLLCLLVVLFAVIVLFLGGDKPESNEHGTADSLQNATAVKSGEPQEGGYAVAPKEIRLTYFDPNTADSTQLLSLGLQPWQVRNIYRYRAAGGVYSSPEDFAQLYGLTVKKYRELLPYIRISEEYRMASEVYKRPAYHKQYDDAHHAGTAAGTDRIQAADRQAADMYYPAKLKAGETIMLNDADTLMLRRVPGVGPYFARRITKYRERLGGFVSTDQLLEIQDFPESALPYLALDDNAAASVKKININSATSEELRRHPYISFVMARQIIDYRRLRGNISDLDDLRLLPTFNDDVIHRLRPYIVYE